MPSGEKVQKWQFRTIFFRRLSRIDSLIIGNQGRGKGQKEVQPVAALLNFRPITDYEIAAIEIPHFGLYPGAKSAPDILFQDDYTGKTGFGQKLFSHGYPAAQ